jgi:hypothetical protein
MKTAVEWLGNEITNRITRRNPHDTIIIQTLGEVLIELIEQAKEMEKEQMKLAWKDGKYCDTIYNEVNYEDAEQYYNETFKSE